jgi:hypothetical protein
LDEEKEPPSEHKQGPVISKREKLILSIGDLLMIVMIIVDLLYLSGLIQLNSGDVLALTVFVLSISFVVYQMKKRIRKRTARELSEK